MTDRTTSGYVPGITDLRLLRRELDRIADPAATLALMVLLTMQTPADVRLMDWRDVDLPSGTWILPGRPHRVALLGSAAIATLIARAPGGVRSEGPVIQGAAGRTASVPPAGACPLADLLPPDLAHWTIDTVHRVAWSEWRHVIRLDLPRLATTGHTGDAGELIRRRHLARHALEEWARLLR